MIFKPSYIVGTSSNSITSNSFNEIRELDRIRTYYNNKDIVGILKINNTEFNEPVVKYTDNDFYLDHNNYNEYDKRGAIYMDYRVNKDSRKILIYGHNSKDIDVPFKILDNYYENNYYLDHNIISLELDNVILKYQIYSVFVETDDFTYMNLNLTNEEFNRQFKSFKLKSIYNTGVDVLDNDNILILQTCCEEDEYIKYDRKYLLIVARRINE